jgi:hypothetical protein
MEILVKLVSSVPSVFRFLLVAGGLSVAAAGLISTPTPLYASTPAQESSADSSAMPSVTGNWQVSWTAANGTQRQVTMQLKQDGKKLSGTFQGERGSAPLKGSLDGSRISLNVKLPRRQASFNGTVEGDKMSGTTEQGAPWTATRQQ